MGSMLVEVTVVGSLELEQEARRELDLRWEQTRTTLCLGVRDQAALYGAVQRLASLGLELVGLRTAPTGRHAAVEVVVRGPVGALLQSALGNVERATSTTTSSIELQDVDVERLLAALEHGAASPAMGDEGGGGLRQGDTTGASAAGKPDPRTVREEPMNETLDETGPIDWLVVEFPENKLNGEAMPLLIDLVDRGIIRILDLAFVAKDSDGVVTGVEIRDLDTTGDFDLTIFEGASSGLLDEDDRREAGEALQPGSAAGILVYENAWAGPFASAVRRGGGFVLAGGRIPVQSIIAALDAAEASAPEASAPEAS